MSFISKTGKLASFLTKTSFRRKASLVGVGIASGAAAGFSSGMPGHRKDYAKEGAMTGGLLAAGSIFAAGKAMKGAGKAMKGAGKLATGAKTVFRRIRGRIIPIRVK